jgi:hypothetical protein
MNNYNYSTKDFREARAKWVSTTPIRGRAVDTRPLGKRSKTHETVTQGDGYYAYALHGNEVLKFFPDGKIHVDCHRWHTPSTRDFLAKWFTYARILDNRVWVSGYPVPDKGVLELVAREGCHYYITPEPLVWYKRGTDRKRTKEVREANADFLRFAKSILTLTDGQVTYAMMQACAVDREVVRHAHQPHGMALYVFSRELKYESHELAYSRLRSSDPDTDNLYMSILSSMVRMIPKALPEYALVGDVYEPTYHVGYDRFEKAFLKVAYRIEGVDKYDPITCDGTVMENLVEKKPRDAE